MNLSPGRDTIKIPEEAETIFWDADFYEHCPGFVLSGITEGGFTAPVKIGKHHVDITPCLSDDDEDIVFQLQLGWYEIKTFETLQEAKIAGFLFYWMMCDAQEEVL
jgi:hypothetical protein